MKKKLRNYLFVLGIVPLVALVGCIGEADTIESTMAAVAARRTGVTKITLNTSHGTSVVNFDNAKRKIISSRSTDKETGLVTSRSYDYDSNNNIRSLNIKKLYSPEVTYYYEDALENTSRSVISKEIEDIPVKIRRVVKSTGVTSRSAESEQEFRTEYYADENGQIVGILQVDKYNNLKIKSLED